MNPHRAFVAIALATATLCGSAQAQHNEFTDRMLASAVYVECVVEYKGEPLQGNSGTGFLVAGADNVVTNNHVVEACNPDNRIKLLADLAVKNIFAEMKKGNWPGKLKEEIEANPQLMERLKNDKELLKKTVAEYASRLATAQAKTAAPNMVQKLYVMVLGKSTKDPVRFDVTRIVWNSDTSNETASARGVDLAILKLDRPIPGGEPVSFATGESARVNDQVYSVGFPGASGNAVSSNKLVPTLKRGIVSKLNGESPYLKPEAKARGLHGARVIETDASISSGNSGGPLFNDLGEVLGVNSFVSTTASGVGWAQDSIELIPILQDLGLPVPRVRSAPPGWLERNQSTVWGGGIALAVLLLGGTAVILMRRPGRAPAAAAAAAAPAGKQGARQAGGAMTAATLLGREGQFRDISIPIPALGLELGRGMPADGRLAFAEDSDVSRHHALIVYDEGSRRFRVTDHGSSNGTASLPDGMKLPPKQVMEFRPGQAIRLGDHNVFELRAS